jgi:large exoprotein involved in heme utilization and adhesion
VDIKLQEDLTASNESLISSATLGGGKGGDILIDVKKLALSSGSAFDTPTKGAGMGGSLTINASDSVSISGSIGTSISGIYNNAFGEGNGGIVSVTTPILAMDKGARIETASVASGNAGELCLNTGTLNMTDGAYITTQSKGSGNAGILNITSSESISLSGADTGIYCNAFSSGAGGSSIITTPVLNISKGAKIQSGAVGTGNGGDLYIKVGNLFLAGDGSEINTSSFGAGRGGSLHIDAS